MSSRVAKATGKIAAIATAASVAGAAVGQVGIAAGVMGVGLAGAAALAVPSLVAIKLGADGVKQAAQKAVPAVTKLKQSVSGRFATDMIPGFTALGRVATSLTPAMTGLAGTISGVFNGLAGTVERNTGGLAALTRGAGTFVSTLAPGLNQLVTGMISFGANASKSAGIIGGELGSAIGKVGQWIGNLPIDKLITTYTPMIKTLIGGIGDLAGPVVKLFGDLALAAGPSLAAIFTSLGAAVTALTPPLSQIARDAGPALAEAFANLAPALGTLGGSFATLISAIAPVLPPLAQFAATLVDTLGPALPAALIGITAFSAAMKFAPAVSAVGSAVMGLANGFVALRTVVTILGPLGAIQAFMPLLGTALTTVATGMRVAAVATWTWTAALLANPITWVVLAVVALIAVIVLIATKTTWFQTIWAAMVSFVTTAWNTMCAFVSAIFSAAMSLVQSIVSVAVSFISAQWNLIASVASAVWAGITAVVSGAANVISSVISGAINIAIGVFNTFRAIGTGAFQAVASAVSAIGSAVQTVIGWVQSLISAIGNISFPSPPSWLSSIFELGDGATIIAHRYAGVGGGTITAAPGAFSAPAPNLRGAAPVMVNNYYDQSTKVQVDGSGIVDANKVASSVGYAVGRTDRTQGRVPAVVL
ncbi:hypothetical protein [Tsukamurella strandjordii]|uniref:phage tail protein n=1 Tax=Tsukamurella strandjordii TaxID=147577 RepID=UPI0031D65E66